MKVIMKPVQMIAKFDTAGNVTPARFIYDDMVINVEQIISKKKEIFAANPTFVFSCQSEIKGELTRYEIKYELLTSKWYLYKM